MKIVLAPDTFKECLDAKDVCNYLKQGILRASPDADILCQPIADGGEGSASILTDSLGLLQKRLTVSGPLGYPVSAYYGISEDKRVAVVETAQANGIGLVPVADRNPLQTTTRGCGELLLDAIANGVETVYVCIGGSATVDGAKDLASVFGYTFMDASGNELTPGGGSLALLDQIRAPIEKPWENCTIIVLCDVTNPLLGENGAARVFGPQKGATPEMVLQLENGLAQLAVCVKRDLGIDCSEIAGGGAAGGLGAGLHAFLGASLESGAETILNVIGFDSLLAGADAVITGEGKSDHQTLNGKAPQAVAMRARAQGIPVFLVSGDIGDRAVVEKSGIFSYLHSLRQAGETIEQSIADTPMRLAVVAEAIARTLEESTHKDDSI